jgi:hypothetical protein
MNFLSLVFPFFPFFTLKVFQSDIHYPLMGYKIDKHNFGVNRIKK